MILVDTSVWIDYFNGQRTWQTNLLDNLLSDVPVIVGDLINWRLPGRCPERAKLQNAEKKGGNGSQDDGCYHRNLLHSRRVTLIA